MQVDFGDVEATFIAGGMQNEQQKGAEMRERRIWDK